MRCVPTRSGVGFRSSIPLFGEYRCCLVLGRKEEGYADACFQEDTLYAGGSVTFWTVITRDDRTGLVFIENSLINAKQ